MNDPRHEAFRRGSDPPIVLVGASAGGVDALVRLVGAIPSGLDAAVLVVLHLPAESRSTLPRILTRSGPLPATHARDGAAIVAGTILVAPPDLHLVVQDDRVRTVRGPRENLNRPAVDPLFRSAAVASNHALVAIVLSGALDDGVAGAVAVREVGGTIVVQDPEDALVPGMPRSVLEVMRPDHTLRADEIGARLPELVAEAARRGRRDAARLALVRQEVGMSTLTPAGDEQGEPPGESSGFGCPDCGGVLWELTESGRIRFRCRTGHAYSSRALMAAQDESLEDALWSALRALEEQAALSKRLVERTVALGAERTRQRLTQRADEATNRAGVLRRFLMTEPVPSDGPAADVGVGAHAEQAG